MKRVWLLCLFCLALALVVNAGKHGGRKKNRDHRDESKRADMTCGEFISDDGSYYNLKKLVKKEKPRRFTDDASGASVSLSFCRSLSALKKSQAPCDETTTVCIELANGTHFSAGRLANASISELPSPRLLGHEGEKPEHRDEDDESGKENRKHERRPEKEDDRDDDNDDDDDDNEHQRRKTRRGVQVEYVNGDVCPSDETQLLSTVVQLECGGKKKFKMSSFSMDNCTVQIVATSRVACPRGERGHGHGGNDDDEELLVIVLPAVLGFCAVLTLLVACVLAARRRRAMRDMQLRNAGAQDTYPAVAYQSLSEAPEAARPAAPVLQSAMVPNFGQNTAIQAQGVVYAAPDGSYYVQQPVLYPAFLAPGQYPAPQQTRQDGSLL